MNRSIRKMAGVLSVVTAFAVVMPFAASDAWAQEKAVNLKQQIVGTWSLVAWYLERDGKKIERFGPNPKGISILELNGRFAVIVLRPDLPKFASNNPMTGTADENKAVVQGSWAQFGTYSVNEKDGSMNFHTDGSTYPNWDGQDRKGTVSLSGDERKVCGPFPTGGTVCNVWKRVK